MIGSALKKLAAKNGLTVSDGIAFGSYQGYAISLSEGSGYKLLTVSTHLTDTAIQWLQSQLGAHNLTKEFRVRDTQFDATGIQVVIQRQSRHHEALRGVSPVVLPAAQSVRRFRLHRLLPLRSALWRRGKLENDR